MATFICARCKEEKPEEHSSIGTGYGQNLKGEKFCYPCCGELDKEEMDEKGKAILYLTKKPIGTTSSYQWWVSNWPDSFSYQAFVKHGRHNIARTRIDAWFRDHKGRDWWGVSYGSFSDLIYCKRTKERK